VQVFWDDNASVVEKAVFPCGSSLLAQTYNSLTDVQKLITLRPFIISRRANNRWKHKKVFYISCTWIQVRFPSKQSQLCTYWLLLAVKSDSASILKFSFWSFLGGFKDGHLSWCFNNMMGYLYYVRDCSFHKTGLIQMAPSLKPESCWFNPEAALNSLKIVNPLVLWLIQGPLIMSPLP
jgi:hypothetical protein